MWGGARWRCCMRGCRTGSGEFRRLLRERPVRGPGRARATTPRTSICGIAANPQHRSLSWMKVWELADIAVELRRARSQLVVFPPAGSPVPTAHEFAVFPTSWSGPDGLRCRSSTATSGGASACGRSASCTRSASVPDLSSWSDAAARARSCSSERPGSSAPRPSSSPRSRPSGRPGGRGRPTVRALRCRG